MTRGEEIFVINELIDLLNEKATREQVEQRDLDFRRFVGLSLRANFDDLLTEGEIQLVEDYLCKQAIACGYPANNMPVVSTRLNMQELAMFIEIGEEELSDIQIKLSTMSDVMRREGDLRADYLDLALEAITEILGTIDEPLGRNI